MRIADEGSVLSGIALIVAVIMLYMMSPKPDSRQSATYAGGMISDNLEFYRETGPRNVDCYNADPIPKIADHMDVEEVCWTTEDGIFIYDSHIYLDLGVHVWANRFDEVERTIQVIKCSDRTFASPGNFADSSRAWRPQVRGTFSPTEMKVGVINQECL